MYNPTKSETTIAKGDSTVLPSQLETRARARISDIEIARKAFQISGVSSVRGPDVKKQYRDDPNSLPLRPVPITTETLSARSPSLPLSLSRRPLCATLFLFLFFFPPSPPPLACVPRSCHPLVKFFCMPLVSRNAAQCNPGMHCGSVSVDTPSDVDSATTAAATATISTRS